MTLSRRGQLAAVAVAVLVAVCLGYALFKSMTRTGTPFNELRRPHVVMINSSTVPLQVIEINRQSQAERLMMSDVLPGSSQYMPLPADPGTCNLAALYVARSGSRSTSQRQLCDGEKWAVSDRDLT